ncbi:unnamed protein product [Closterium sp. NIES-65]|nr:unnamed protein product [Closterium sp. NIES-65]
MGNPTCGMDELLAGMEQHHLLPCDVDVGGAATPSSATPLNILLHPSDPPHSWATLILGNPTCRMDELLAGMEQHHLLPHCPLVTRLSKPCFTSPNPSPQLGNPSYRMDRAIGGHGAAPPAAGVTWSWATLIVEWTSYWRAWSSITCCRCDMEVGGCGHPNAIQHVLRRAPPIFTTGGFKGLSCTGEGVCGGMHGGVHGGMHGGVHGGMHGGVHGGMHGGMHGGVHGGMHGGVHGGGPRGGCTGGCRRGGSTGGCTRGCTRGCTGGCMGGCTGGCTGGCMGRCTGGCMGGCTGGVHGGGARGGAWGDADPPTPFIMFCAVLHPSSPLSWGGQSDREEAEDIGLTLAALDMHMDVGVVYRVLGWQSDREEAEDIGLNSGSTGRADGRGRVLGWQSDREEAEDIGLTLAALDVHMDVGVVYRGLRGPQRVRVVCVVCYYGRHYHCFSFHADLGKWVMFDDTTVKVVGGWADVVSSCTRGRLQPQVLFYEAC